MKTILNIKPMLNRIIIISTIVCLTNVLNVQHLQAEEFSQEDFKKMQGRWIGTFTGSFTGDGILTEKGATYISKCTTEWVIPDRMTKWVWTVTKEGDKKPSTTYGGIVYWNESTKEVLGHCVSDDGLNWNERMTKFGDVVERKRKGTSRKGKFNETEVNDWSNIDAPVVVSTMKFKNEEKTVTKSILKREK
jgi:hypothetical protein